MASVQQLLQEYSPSAFALAFRMLGCRATAEDVLQDSVFATMRSRKVPREQQAFRFWFTLVVRNRVIDQLRQNARRNHQTIDEALEETLSNEDRLQNPQAIVEAEQTKSLVERTLDCLSNEHREILLLKDWQGFSYKEIAQILDVESGTVMSRLHRARMAFKQAYEEVQL